MQKDFHLSNKYIKDEIDADYADSLIDFINSPIFNRFTLTMLCTSGLTPKPLLTLVVSVFVLSRLDIQSKYNGDIHVAIQSILHVDFNTYRNHLSEARRVLGYLSTHAMYTDIYFLLINRFQAYFIKDSSDVEGYTVESTLGLFDRNRICDYVVRNKLKMVIDNSWIHWGSYVTLVGDINLTELESILLWLLVILPNNVPYSRVELERILGKSDWFVNQALESLYKKMDLVVDVKCRKSPLTLFSALLHYGLFTDKYLQGVEEEVLVKEG